MEAMRSFRNASFLLLLTVPLWGQLRDSANQRLIKFGAAVDPTKFSEAAYASALAREFNQVEAENVMKFGPIHPTKRSEEHTSELQSH